MNMEDNDEEKLCYKCVTDEYLSEEIRIGGISCICSYCKKKRRSYTLSKMADRVEEAFEQHFEPTNDQPTEEEYYRQHSDPESSYWWYREGESLPFLLEDMGGIPEQAAEDIQAILQSRYDNHDNDFEEQRFSSEALYEMRGVSDHLWQQDWDEFERVVQSESRFFSRKVYDYLTRVFTGLEKFTSYKAAPLIRKAGASKGIKGLYRARVFQDRDEILSVIKSPDQQIGTPSSKFARGGRMNAQGVAVFYGATSHELALAEVRPPVGSKVVIGYFEILRPLRLLDLTALRNARAEGSIFDPQYAPLREKALFLSRLVDRIALPVMPSQESKDYLSTQIIADFLAEANDPPYDGIIFSSTQSKKEGANVVLFHRAARVQQIDLVEGATITAHSSVYEPAEGEYESYNVVVQQPGKLKKKEPIKDHVYHPRIGFLPSPRWPIVEDTREITLKIRENDLQIFEISSLEVITKEIPYQRATVKEECKIKKPEILDF
ncbi:RES domain-containing protein [Pedobacter roseus]|uniref:RES domain-containing protein n=1 Tax=Pedobacter roseus TaxID=336820 RepID=A0A7G9QH12_9SPHI|nr:RES domain-containing protein [Pedobacter roseus]QNN42637.1 RES domain-containing protein [Pedobacter roseus]